MKHHPLQGGTCKERTHRGWRRQLTEQPVFSQSSRELKSPGERKQNLVRLPGKRPLRDKGKVGSSSRKRVSNAKKSFFNKKRWQRGIGDSTLNRYSGVQTVRNGRVYEGTNTRSGQGGPRMKSKTSFARAQVGKP